MFSVLGDLLTKLPTLILLAVLAWNATMWMRGKGSPERMDQVLLVWFLACIPIHGHGVMPLLLADKMVDMAAYPETFFGVYPEYCQVDTRYCNQNFFIMILQGFAGFALGPLCAIAAYGLWKGRHWSVTVAISICAIQMYTTAAFFAEPFLHDTFPISRENPGLFWFGYLFMNGLWIVFPALGLYHYTRKLSASNS